MVKRTCVKGVHDLGKRQPVVLNECRAATCRRHDVEQLRTLVVPCFPFMLGSPE